MRSRWRAADGERGTREGADGEGGEEATEHAGRVIIGRDPEAHTGEGVREGDTGKGTRREEVGMEQAGPGPVRLDEIEDSREHTDGSEQHPALVVAIEGEGEEDPGNEGDGGEGGLLGGHLGSPARRGDAGGEETSSTPS